MHVLLVIMMLLNSEIVVDATVYNPSVRQTDSTPYLTASGIVINPIKLRNGNLRYVSISRDLRHKYKYGTYITVKSDNVYYNGQWKVVDTMHRRFKHKVDFLQHSNNKRKPPRKVTIL
jgi:hypothetical protein